MLLGTVGLSTWRWNNNLKSLLLLAMFPAMLVLLLWGIVFVSGEILVNFSTDEIVSDGQLFLPPRFLGLDMPGGGVTPLQLANLIVIGSWPWVVGISVAWTALGYFFHGALLRASTGARPVSRQEAPGLYNILENLCISRGMQMPKLYIIETPALNAFATGIDRRSYAITVTSGILQALDERELSAVLAHELTHIINRDVRLLVVTIVFAGMISFLSHMLWRSMRFNRPRGNGKRGGGVLVIILVAGVFLLIGNLLALLLRLALSRRREYMADAGSVDLTHDPEAMIGALRKISGNAAMPQVAADVRQMFIENPPTFAGFFGLFSTHPSIDDRIAVLEKLTGLTPVARGHTHIPPVSTQD
ncbi:MAG: M48 family metallopeptidase [Alphaproteobacteria bacterium]